MVGGLTENVFVLWTCPPVVRRAFVMVFDACTLALL